MESKILDVDKDEWIYHTMKRYADLYMFELEFPVDAIEIIDGTSICLSGIQEYSKKCEILQLSIPQKLLTNGMDEGLCKDRDFNMISGGYASGRILQIKPIKSFPSFVIAAEEERNGVTMFKLGDENCAVLKEQAKLVIPECTTPATGKCPGVIDTHCSSVVMGLSHGKSLVEWKLEDQFISSGHSSASEHILCSSKDSPLYGGITKLKFWDEKSVSFCTSKGVVCIYDLRTGKPLQDSIILQGTKSPLNSAAAASNVTDQPCSSEDAATCSSSSQAHPSPSAAFSFDTIPSQHKVGLVDSYGGYETFDIRNAAGPAGGRTGIPGFERNSGIISQRFNIEYSPEKNKSNFILTGLREECVQVVREDFASSTPLQTLFVHDGHCKTVTHALWHPAADRLIFSASLDSMLHAWQFNTEEPLLE